MSELQANQKLEVLCFLIQDVRICIQLKYLKQVLLLPLLEPVPDGPPYLAGLMNIAHMSVPVIDLSILFNLPDSKFYTLNTPVLLCSDAKRSIGLVIDEIIGLAEVDEDVQMTEQFSETETFFSAVVRVESQLTLLLNMEELFSKNVIANPKTVSMEF